MRNDVVQRLAAAMLVALSKTNEGEGLEATNEEVSFAFIVAFESVTVIRLADYTGFDFEGALSEYVSKKEGSNVD